jgi:hypothetical protein
MDDPGACRSTLYFPLASEKHSLRAIPQRCSKAIPAFLNCQDKRMLLQLTKWFTIIRPGSLMNNFSKTLGLICVLAMNGAGQRTGSGGNGVAAADELYKTGRFVDAERA